MERCAYLVNSTPKYYGILPLHFTMLRRYGWTFPAFFATEVPDHPVCEQLIKMGVELLIIKEGDAGFLDSRAAALRELKRLGEFDYVIPAQDDFLLDRAPNFAALHDAMKLLNTGPIVSARLMPCPRPGGPAMNSAPDWMGLTPVTDTYGFTFQATMWRLDACADWYDGLCTKLEIEWPVATTNAKLRRQVEITANFAENSEGQKFFWEFFKARKQVHVGWRRAGSWSNAVYLCPWPYRPTAIVQGRLEPWAKELGEREGVPIIL